MTTPVLLMGDSRADGKPLGTVTNPLVTSSGGAPATLGRKAAASSSSVALSNEDSASLALASGTYSDAILYAGATTVGRGVAIVASAAGTATLTFASANTLVVPAPVGTSILPFACTNAIQTTGTLTAYKLL